MVDAESGWKDVVDDANARFTAATKAQVKVEYQQWANHYTRLDTTLAGTDVPDVVELGNTDMPEVRLQRRVRRDRQSRAGSRTPSTWLTGLSGPVHARRQDLLRALLRRRPGADLPHRPVREAAGLQPPTTYAELLAAADKLKTDNAPTRTSPPSTCRVPTGTPRCRGSTARAARSPTKGSRRQVGRHPVRPGGAGRSAEVGRPGEELLEG